MRDGIPGRCGDAATATANDFPAAAQESAPPSVLIVDDEPLIRWSVAQTLGDSGYRVVEAGDADAAMRAFGAAPVRPVAVLLDFDLPDSDGLNVLARMHAISPATPVILMTVFGSDDLRNRARALGAFGFIDKPFEMGTLGPLVDRAVAARAAVVPAR